MTSKGGISMSPKMSGCEKTVDKDKVEEGRSRDDVEVSPIDAEGEQAE